MDGQKTYGITSPISLSKPTRKEISLTQEVKKVIKQLDGYQTTEELERMQEVVLKANRLMKDFVKRIGIEKKLKPEFVEQCGGKICTFGAYELGIRAFKIDALCVAPCHVFRTDFFTTFYSMLEEHEGVRNLRAIENAFFPIIRLNFDDVEMMILFARLALSIIPEDHDFRDDDILKNMDERCIRSLNRYRVTEELQRLVPNMANFRDTLGAIKLWAYQRDIYSNIVGFLGDDALDILVARTCQLFPNAVASTLIQKFFMMFSEWEWPRPVLLKETERNHALSLPVWDPRYNPRDRLDLMPIITPVYPHLNSAYNVTKSSLSVMKEEFLNGYRITLEIHENKAPWSKLFEKPDFFLKYNHFIVLSASAKDEDQNRKWAGLVESKIRILVGYLERNDHILISHINPASFAPEEETSEHVTRWFVGLKFKKELQNPRIDLTREIQRFSNIVLEQARENCAYEEDMKVEAVHAKRNRLADYLPANVYETISRKISSRKKRFVGAEMDIQGQASTYDASAEGAEVGSACAKRSDVVKCIRPNVGQTTRLRRISRKAKASQKRSQPYHIVTRSMSRKKKEQRSRRKGNKCGASP